MRVVPCESPVDAECFYIGFMAKAVQVSSQCSKVYRWCFGPMNDTLLHWLHFGGILLHRQKFGDSFLKIVISKLCFEDWRRLLAGCKAVAPRKMIYGTFTGPLTGRELGLYIII